MDARARFATRLIAIFALCSSLVSAMVANAGTPPKAKEPTVSRDRTVLQALHLKDEGTSDGGSILDEVGKLGRPVSPEVFTLWKQELKTSCQSLERRAWLHLRIGEYELAKNEAPERAIWHFRQARKISPSTHPSHGRAAFSAAISLFYQGRYDQARGEFRHLLDPKAALRGFDGNQCSLWFRHASACAGYHEERRELGITEPERLDPLCAAAGLAVCLRALDLPFDKKTVLGACRVTGMGSNLQDVMNACEKLGVAGHIVTADEQGLKLLPKPVLAYVEHDHYVTVLRADDQGVGYSCSDCGHWPGGYREVSWKQWRAMDPGLYVTVARRGSKADRLLNLVHSSPQQQAGVRLASAQLNQNLQQLAQLTALANQLKGHVTVYLQHDNPAWCGIKPSALHCEIGVCCPFDGSGPGGRGGGRGGGGIGLGGRGWLALSRGGAFGPSAGDPVNLATGEEEYQPSPDLVVYNPHGPAVAWQRLHNTLRSHASDYQSEDFGIGWSHQYNVHVWDPQGVQYNTQLQQGTTNLVGLDGTNAPPVGLTWDIVQGGGTVATSAQTNGWSVSEAYGGSSLSITVPAMATSAVGYEVRYRNQYGGAVSKVFDVLPTGSVPQGGTVMFVPTGSTAPATGLTWEVLHNSVTIATSASPGAWSVTYEGYPVQALRVTPALDAVIGSGYEVRYRQDPYSQAQSATFSVIAARFSARSGEKLLVFPNGSRLSLNAGSVPTSTQTQVICTVRAGAPLMASWNYDANNPLGYYVVTFSDGTVWTAAPLVVRPGYGFANSLVRLADNVGNALSFTYANVVGGTPYGHLNSGLPVLTAIKDASTGTSLLTIARAADGTGNILSVSDCLGRSVY